MPRVADGPADAPASDPSRLTAWIGLGGLLAASFLICVSATRSELLLPSTLRPLPGWLAGPLAGAGASLGLAELVVVFIVLFVSYAVTANTSQRLSARVVLVAILALHAMALLAPPLFSSDVFSYAAYAKIGTVYGANPYLHGPDAFPLEALHPLIGVEWSSTPTVYGPVFTVLSYLLVPLGIAANVLAYKAVAAASSLALCFLIWRAAQLRGLDPVKAAALVGLNPIIVLFGVGGGHNDLLMLALLAAGLYVLLQERAMPSGALMVTATAVKLTAGLMLPFALIAERRMTERSARYRLLLGATIAASVVLLLAFALWGTGPLQMLGTLQGIQAKGGPHSLVGFTATELGAPGLTGPLDSALTVVFAVTLVWLLHAVWIGRIDWIAGAGWATAVLLLTTGFLVPWYIGWLIPLAALGRDRRLLGVAIFLTGVGLTTL
ncbi:MAG: polyprenol phosphomannose-dependent alpha 1,6 mannosyltransferase MptB [Actinobacteria bacterium]|nr:polyprenol phosphomannose-dependent alpha 1,6 mannosyltransferase MptB [Actinomycetota bacterium]